MRLIAAHPGPDRYGADLMLLAALRALRADGDEVTVALPTDGPLVPELCEAGLGIQLVRFPVLRKSALRPTGILRLAFEVPLAIWNAVRLIRRSDADLVYVNTVTIPVWIVAARVARVPVVCHVREAEDQLHPLLQRAITAPLALATRVIANSHHTGDRLAELWPSLRRRITVVHNGFAFATVPPARPPAPDGELLLVGRLSPRKGQDVAIRALARLHADGLRLRLRLVGTEFPGYEWYVEELRRDADDLGVGTDVLFDGYRTDIDACNRAADVVLVPSRVEPFGNVAVEALAAARPLVVSDTGGLSEIVDDGETGRLVPPDDPEALARAIAELLHDPEHAAAMASEGASRVRRRFGLDRYHAEIRDLLHATAARRGRR